MTRSTQWMIPLALTTLLAFPVAASAHLSFPSVGQQPPSQPPDPQPPTQPPTERPAAPAQPPAQQPTTTPEQPQTTPSAEPSADQAKRHLVAAREALSDVTQLPAASQLTGEARTQVSQLIANFNELITTNSNWRESYAKLQTNLTALIGTSTSDEAPTPPAGTPGASGTAGAVGTSGTAASSLDPNIRAKLVEFQNHMKEFERAAGGGSSQPETQATPSDAAAAPSSAAPPASQDPTTQPEQSRQADSADPVKHIEAIEAILAAEAGASPPTATGGSGTSAPGTAGTSGSSPSTGSVTLDREQVNRIKMHLAELKRQIEKK